jgi:hypothetical protein
MFANAYPYGEIEPFSRPHCGAPTALTTHRPDLPSWLGQVLARAHAVRPEDRFESVLSLLFELDHGADRALAERPRPQPLLERNPLGFWKGVSAILALLLALAAGALLAHPLK